MASSNAPDLNALIEALRWHDDDSRERRAGRIAWSSSLYQNPGLIVGRAVPLHLMEEARISFVNGQFMTVVISATAVIEHFLVGELMSNTTSGNSETFARAIRSTRAAGTLPASLLDDIDDLRKRRNSFVHRNADAGPNSLAERYRRHEVHPMAVLEADAKFALSLMYSVFLSMLSRT